MSLTKDQAIHCANVFSNYFDRFERIDDYIRDQKLNSLSERPTALFGMGPEDDLFSDFTINPSDMQFELVELPQDTWDIYLNMISSHSNMTSIPGLCLRLAILEKKTKGMVIGISGIVGIRCALQFFSTDIQIVIERVVIAKGPRRGNRITLLGKVISHLNNAICHSLKQSPGGLNVKGQFIDPCAIDNVGVRGLHKVVQSLAKQSNFFLIGHLSILSVVRPQVYHGASTLQHTLNI